MRKLIIISAQIVFVVLISAGVSAAGRITGYVYGTDRHPIPDVYVELSHELGAYSARTKTNVRGFYAFHRLPEGIYRIKVVPYTTGYAAEERSVTLTTLSAFDEASEEVDFRLRPKDTATSSSPPASVFVQEVPNQARKLYDAAIKDLEKKNEQPGLEKLRAAIDAFPTYHAALSRLGMEYILRSDYNSAKPLLEKAVEVNPRSYEGWFGLGLVQFEMSDLEKATESFKQAAEINPSSVNAHLWHGTALHARNKLKEAEPAYLQADKLGKGSIPRVHWQLARLFMDLGRDLEAAKRLELYLKHTPNHPKAGDLRKTINRLKQKPETDK